MTKEIHDINSKCVDFVVELIDYIAEYPDDDYMTMECLCRKLVKHDLIDKKDGYYLVDKGIKLAEQTEPQIVDWKDEMWAEAREQLEKCLAEKDEPQWTKENCKGCKYNKYPYDSSSCFVRVCINGNKYEPTTEDCSMVADCPWK